MRIKIIKNNPDLNEGDVGVVVKEGKIEFAIKFAKEDYKDLSKEELIKNVVEIINSVIQLIKETTWKYKIITRPLGILRIYLEDLIYKIDKIVNKN